MSFSIIAPPFHLIPPHKTPHVSQTSNHRNPRRTLIPENRRDAKMAGGAALVGWLKAVFIVLGALMVATLIYTIAIDGLPFRIELLTPWMAATLVDYYINVVPLAAWVSYKETNWVARVVWIILLVCLGRNGTDHKNNGLRLTTARVAFSVLGFIMLGTLVYTITTDGSPFRKELLTPWLTATLIDFYINVAALSVWVGYKESRWFGKVAWIAGLICFGSIVTSAYVAYQFFQLSALDPLYLVLLNSKQRAESRYERASG